MTNNKFQIVKSSDGRTRIIRCKDLSQACKSPNIHKYQQIEVQCFDSEQIDRIIGMQIKAAKQSRKPIERVMAKIKSIGIKKSRSC